MTDELLSLEISITGIVQGVGFRPFVCRLTQQMGIGGQVLNNGGNVFIIASGSQMLLEQFLYRLENECPPKAAIQKIDFSPIQYRTFDGFGIVKSQSTDKATPLIPADLSICADCQNELFNTKSRHYLNPFISCVSCGPRYSIIESLPYDHCRTTMTDFQMCEDCQREYSSAGIRDYSQTLSCQHCGPKLILHTKDGELFTEQALKRGIAVLKSGGILAVKGTGGFHFACSPFSDESVQRLRKLKGRDKKPFAVMLGSISGIKQYCTVSQKEEELLLSDPRPIVLLNIHNNTFSPLVSGESRFLGAFLPNTPLQELLIKACGPLVMTSGNISGEPVMFEDDTMLALPSDYLDGVLYHNRRILTPLDDSVAYIMDGRQQMVRRSRGYVPLPVNTIAITAPPIFAAGGDLKAVFCLYQDGKAYMSQYFGDMENNKVFQAYKHNYQRMSLLLGIQPAYGVCDLHRGYFTSSFARHLGLKTIEIQHHHAHIASVMAEHGLSKKLIGIAFDGVGLGTDGNIWGGEFFVCSGAEFSRAAHLSYVPICGGDSASKDASLCALCYLLAAGCESTWSDQRETIIKAALRENIGVQKYSSMGRLFDAVSAILGMKMQNSYEGECAIALENAAYVHETEGGSAYPLHFDIIENEELLHIDQLSVIKQIIIGLQDNASVGALALGFHHALSDMVLEVCSRLKKKYGLDTVALSGGVFANRLLLKSCINKLTNHGFGVYLNESVPCNDGGLALGQAYLAALQIKEEGNESCV